MQFAVARPDVIQAINQRWLLKFWQQHLGALRVPQWQAVEAEDLTRIADGLSFLDVMRGASGARFMIRFHGATIGRVYGSGDCRGRFLDEIVQPDTCASGLAPYHQAAETGRPVYTIEDMTDRQGRLVHNERLLLPFSRGGATVDCILAAFEFICPDGAFDSRELMKAQNVPPTLRLSATIAPQAVA